MTNEYKFIPGQRLRLELQTEFIEGDYDSGGRDRIDLVNIVDLLNNVQIKDKLSFYRNEIVQLRCLDDPIDAETNAANPTNQQDDVGRLSIKENKRLADLTLNFIYIDKPDEAYKKATSRLLQAENVGVVGMCGMSSLKLLVISLVDQVYMFDMLVWPGKRFPKELSDLLSASDIKKVVHDSQSLKTCLWKSHGIALNNIFDTQVADAMIYKNDTGEKLDQMRSLSNCLLSHLHLSTHFLELIANVHEESWDKRPLDYFQVRQASFLATYLLTLKNHLHRIMLKPFHRSVDLSANYLQNMSWYETHAALTSKKVCQNQKDYLNSQSDAFAYF